MSPLTDTQQDALTRAVLHDQLEAERDTLVQVLRDAGDADDANVTATLGETEHLSVADAASMNDRLRAMSEANLAEVEAALARFDAGTYGQCVTCGSTIPLERLEIVPAAGRCIACQETREGH